MAGNAKLDLGDKTIELPVIEGSEGEKAIDISRLRAETGFITLDNGFVNTGSCTSAVTFLNGEKGILRYRGYPIEQLAEKSNFLEVSWLLYYGELPTKAQLENFEKKVASFNKLPEGLETIISTFPKTAHPMGVLSSATAALSAYYQDHLGPNPTDNDKEELFAQLLGQVKLIVARSYRNSQGLDPIESDSSLSYSKDFLNMMFGEADDEVAKALDVLLILHADHEQNCSASTVRVVGSSHANIFATISGGIDALWGQLHGGANQAVLEMLEEIKNAGGDAEKALEKAKDKEDPFKLMGFGHRVYKNFDPRAKIIKVQCDKVLEKLNVNDPLLTIAKGLEKQALEDEYFVKRKLYPNVDFYSGIIYKALGIPTNMFTAMFVLGRLPGWMSQWKELREDPAAKICRPRQIYTGATERNYKDLGER
ncbi:citrate (Si)-synthase [Halobacteriovorax marinus]|uniref:Citrate synthase n=1 Tax=Halobacteriovorax marinus (strain ATCC BAA-682 / DSM 15412 / SJ) TaxID=862908 RepID=E1WXU5_HALMS|nr:citrate synthase [Halobacteriovorax marinus]ATH07277.1 citrate (Si)-synthase [Halobacteriovorax marinus]CBW25902.1 putative citrate synthase I [Halobacteriovorax marinus SJ]